MYTSSFGEHITSIGRVPGWWIGEALSYMDGRREIKYLQRTIMLQRPSVLQVKWLFLTTASWPGNRLTRGYGRVPLMSNLAGNSSTLWRLRPAIYAAAQKYIASETSTQPRITNLLMPYVPVGIKEIKKKKIHIIL